MITKKELLSRIIDLETQIDWAINQIEWLIKENEKRKKEWQEKVKKQTKNI